MSVIHLVNYKTVQSLPSVNRRYNRRTRLSAKHSSALSGTKINFQMDAKYLLITFSYFFQMVFMEMHTQELDLLQLYKSSMSRFDDVKMTQNSVSFGSQTNDLLVRGNQIGKLSGGFKEQEDKTFVTVAKLDEMDETGKSVLISVKSPLSDKKFFEIFIRKSEPLEHALEGQYFRSNVNKAQFSLGISYVSVDGMHSQLVSLEDRFKLGEWFSLMVRIINHSQLIVYLNCEKLVTEKLYSRVSRIPSFGELRLAQNVEEDFWSSQKIFLNRFIGEMKISKFLFGKEAFETLGPCDYITEVGMAIEGAPMNEKGPDDSRMSFPFEILFGPPSLDCFINFQKYKHGQTWKNGSCTSCSCQNGVTSCHKDKVKCLLSKNISKTSFKNQRRGRKSTEAIKKSLKQ